MSLSFKTRKWIYSRALGWFTRSSKNTVSRISWINQTSTRVDSESRGPSVTSACTLARFAGTSNTVHGWSPSIFIVSWSCISSTVTHTWQEQYLKLVCWNASGAHNSNPNNREWRWDTKIYHIYIYICIYIYCRNKKGNHTRSGQYKPTAISIYVPPQLRDYRFKNVFSNVFLMCKPRLE